MSRNIVAKDKEAAEGETALRESRIWQPRKDLTSKLLRVFMVELKWVL